MSNFRITGLDPNLFSHLFGMNDNELAAQGAIRYVVDEKPGFPDRIEMRDLEIGERALLINYTHLDASSPYRSSHAIFIREGAEKPYDAINEIPDVLSRRLLSVRAFDKKAMMTDARVIEGTELQGWIDRAFADENVEFVDVHNAHRGCFAARVTRA